MSRVTVIIAAHNEGDCLWWTIYSRFASWLPCVLAAMVAMTSHGVAADDASLRSTQADTIEWLDNWEREQVERSRSQREIQHEQDREKGRLSALPDDGVESLSAFADEMHAKWNERDPTFHARMMLEIVRRMGATRRLTGEDIWLPREKCVGLGLHNAEVVPLRLAVQLVEQLRFRSYDAVRALSKEEWSKRRGEQMRHWLHVYRCVHDRIEPNWRESLIKDFKHPVHPPWKYPPPPGMTLSTWKGGMWAYGAKVAPSTIEDLDTRRGYIEALEEHRVYVEKFSEQQEAESLRKRFLPTAEDYVVFAYTYPPHNDDELTAFLDEFVEDADARRRIWERLATARQQSRWSWETKPLRKSADRVE